MSRNGEWIIYYTGGVTFCDQDGSPAAVPREDVQVIARRDPEVGQRYVRAVDYYWWCVNRDTGEGHWDGGDIFGLLSYLKDPADGYAVDGGWTKIVLFGKTIGEREYERLLTEATNNDYLPEKSAWRPNERRPVGGDA